MRNFSLVGLLLAVAIIAYWAKGMLAPSVSHDPNDKSTVEYGDDPVIGERHGPHCECAASAAADVQPTVVRKKEDRPIVGFGQLLRMKNVVGPSDALPGEF